MPAAVAEIERPRVLRTLNVEIDADRDDVYLPSPGEIAAACAAIQSEWSETERARRARGMAGQPRGAKVLDKQFVRLLLDRRSVAEDWAA